MHIALFLKVIQILLKKIHILYCFSWKVTFSMSKINFWIFGFIETKSFPEKRKESLFLVHSENMNTFCENLEQSMAQLEKNYSPSNIHNLIVKRSL